MVTLGMWGIICILIVVTPYAGFWLNGLIDRLYWRIGPLNKKQIRKRLQTAFDNLQPQDDETELPAELESLEPYNENVISALKGGKISRSFRRTFIYTNMLWVFITVLTIYFSKGFDLKILQELAYAFLVTYIFSFAIIHVGRMLTTANTKLLKLSAAGKEALDVSAELLDPPAFRELLTRDKITSYPETYIYALGKYIKMKGSFNSEEADLLKTIWAVPKERVAPWLKEHDTEIEPGLQKANYLRLASYGSGKLGLETLYKSLINYDLTNEDFASWQKLGGSFQYLQELAKAGITFREQYPEVAFGDAEFFRFLASGDYPDLEVLVLYHAHESRDLDFLPFIVRKAEECCYIANQTPNVYSPQSAYANKTTSGTIIHWYDEFMLTIDTMKCIHQTYQKRFPTARRLKKKKKHTARLFCREHLIRPKINIFDYSGSYSTAKFDFELCPLCVHGVPYDQPVRRVVGIIGSEFSYHFDPEAETVYIGLWNEAERQPRYAEIEHLELDLNGLSSPDWAVVSVITTLRTKFSDQTLTGLPADHLPLEENTQRIWRDYIRRRV